MESTKKTLHTTCVSAALLLSANLSLAAADQVLPPIGGDGGSHYSARCAQGEVLAGLALRAADDVDAAGLVCVRPVGPDRAGAPAIDRRSFGGPGGSPVVLTCPANSPAVIAMTVESEGETEVVNKIHLYCAQAAPGQQPAAHPTAVFEGPRYGAPPLLGGSTATRSVMQKCPGGLVAVGISGRSGRWLDSVGLVCGDPPFAPNAGNAAGLQGAAAGWSKPRPPPTTVSSIGKVPVTKAVSAAELETMAARGEWLAGLDPLTVELRQRELSAPGRMGFDIGMAAAEGHTAPGPGKQRIHDALRPAEQKAFDIAVAFTLERNRNRELAELGGVIVGGDRGLAQLREADPDIHYWLGFDIATALFGDPARGAMGSTAMGPGSFAIRNALGPPGQRGFDAAAKFHLNRNYR